MQVILDGHITDISGKQNRVLRVEIPKPLTDAPILLTITRCVSIFWKALIARDLSDFSAFTLP